MKTKIYVTLVLLLALVQAVGAMTAAQIYGPITSIVCGIYSGIVNIVGALAAAVFMISGVKWVASRDDAGARNSARSSMVHAIVGLIIVLLAKTLVEQIAGVGKGCA